MKDFLDKGITGAAFENQSEVDEIYARDLYKQVYFLLNESKVNPYVELKKWRKLGNRFLKYIETVGKTWRMNRIETARLEDGYANRNGERWSEEEDELLVEMACNGSSELELAKQFGRTSSSVHSRLSHLVGIRRLEQTANGYFKGVVDGKYTEGEINGVIKKKGVMTYQ